MGHVSTFLCMESAINRWKIDDQHRISFSLAIDATEVAEGVDIATASKSIIGAAYPYQLISTVDKNSALIKIIADQEEDSPINFEKASECKLCYMVGQQVSPTNHPFPPVLHVLRQTTTPLVLLKMLCVRPR